MDQLLEAIPPDLLVALEASGEGADRLLNAILHCSSSNKRYRREVVQVWAKNAGQSATCVKPGDSRRLSDPELAWLRRELILSPRALIDANDADVGRLVVEMATRQIERWPVEVVAVASNDVEDRLRTVLLECSRAASMDKHGDRMLHGLLKLEIPAYWLGSFADEPPYEAVNTTHGRRANDLVQRWVTLPVDQLADQVDFATTAPHGLVVLGGLLAEVLDNVPSHVAVNTDVLQSSGATLLVFIGLGGDSTPDALGCKTADHRLLIPPPTRPIASLVLAWAALLPDRALHTALTAPNDLPVGGKLREWLV